jgi:hypothetical protein
MSRTLHGNPEACTGMHDGAAFASRRQALAYALQAMLGRQQNTPEGQATLQAVDHLHADNRASFGWRDAEVLRRLAFADACNAVDAARIPTPDVLESDFGALDEEQQRAFPPALPKPGGEA